MLLLVHPKLAPWLTLVVSVLLFSTAYAATPQGHQQKSTSSTTITWSIDRIEVTLSPGESMAEQVSFVSSTKLKKIDVQLSPGISHFLAPHSNRIKKVKSNTPTAIDLNFFIPPGSVEGRYEGALQLRTKDGDLFPRNVSVFINVGIIEYTSQSLGVRVKHPADTDVIEGRDVVFIFDTNYPELPPNYELTLFTPNIDPGNPVQAVLEGIARDRLGDDFVRIVSFDGKGMIVEAHSMNKFHFFVCDPAKNKAAELVGGSPDFLRTNTFKIVSESIAFL